MELTEVGEAKENADDVGAEVDAALPVVPQDAGERLVSVTAGTSDKGDAIATLSSHMALCTQREGGAWRPHPQQGLV